MDAFTDFHFIRPLWLLLIPVLLFAAYWLSRQGHRQTGFEQWIDADLLRHLVTDDNADNRSDKNSSHKNDEDGTHKAKKAISHLLARPIYTLLAGAWLIACIALAGPTWEKLPQPLQQSEQAMVIILDLSPSMRATDNKPSRIVRARLKIKDLLSQRKDGLTALVVYAGEAHTVTPLTDDTKTIANLLSTLTPGLLPIPGSNIEMAMTMATTLVADSGIQHASYVVLTDGIDPKAINSIERTLEKQAHQSLFIMGIGTPEGAPIPSDGSDSNSSQNKSEFLRDGNNNIIQAARNDAVLQEVASAVNGHYLPLQASDDDIDFILQSIERPAFQNSKSENESQREMDQWEEFAPLLLLVFLPLFALMFRRGWLLSLMVIILPVTLPEPVYAQIIDQAKAETPTATKSTLWDELWRNKNQQGQQAFEQQDYATAEKHFNSSENHQWQGSAAYKNKDYQAAADAFAKGDTATDDYNRGNALSQLQQYDDAIEAYDSALKKDPSLSDAKKNKEIIEQIKAQQQKQEQQQGDGDESKDNKDNKEGNESQDQQSKENSDSQQQNKSEQEEQSDSNKSEGEKTEAEKAEEEKQAAEEKKAQKDKNKEDNQQEQGQQLSAFDQLSTEEKQELEQWIQKIPDDPSGLLRRKFEYEFQKRRQLYQSGDWKLPDNNAHERY
ncbi:TPR domain protein in aerotolerance operon [gamma proteobacterium IMCC1989]|nr:TPR domain protein in aerotolerance operon [gamma proteobacterium IMCC1989]